MTDYTAMFSGLGVPVHDTEKLFYKHFPFKIALKDPVAKPKYRNGFSYTSPTQKKAREDYAQARAIFLRKRYRSVTCDQKDWRWMDNQGPGTVSYFFKHATDALAFAVKNKAYLLTITRPTTAAEVEVMLERDEDKAVPVVREHLFWHRFRYCIQFKRTDEAREAADDFWETHIKPHENNDRAMYNFDHDRRLYLNDAIDVFYARMGVGEYFKTFQKAILKSEIADAHEPESGPQAD